MSESKTVDLFFFSSGLLFKVFSILYLDSSISPLFFILNFVKKWHDEVWWLSPMNHVGHSHSHNVGWYNRRMTSYIIKDMMTLVSKSLTMDLTFIFTLHFSFYFILFYFSIFRTTWVRVYWSCCHISHKWWHSHIIDHKMK